MYKPKSGVNAGEENRKRILDYLKEKPDSTGVEISKVLKLSKVTVYSHLSKIIAEAKK